MNRDRAQRFAGTSVLACYYVGLALSTPAEPLLERDTKGVEVR